MNWINLIIGLLKLAGHLLDWIERQSAIREGERRAILRQLDAIQTRIMKAQEEERKVEAMDTKSVDTALEEWYRD